MRDTDVPLGCIGRRRRRRRRGFRANGPRRGNPATLTLQLNIVSNQSQTVPALPPPPEAFSWARVLGNAMEQTVPSEYLRSGGLHGVLGSPAPAQTRGRIRPLHRRLRGAAAPRAASEFSSSRPSTWGWTRPGTTARRRAAAFRGCHRSLRLWWREIDADADYHAVVCYEYRHEEGELQILVLDNHSPTGPPQVG
ncbi:hypothetical protein ACP70R_041701 [Stipagrostis hirtigluma subsp. patula]